jgi:hypothetical protein
METMIIFFPEYYLLIGLFFLFWPHFLPSRVKIQGVGPWR